MTLRRFMQQNFYAQLMMQKIEWGITCQRMQVCRCWSRLFWRADLTTRLKLPVLYMNTGISVHDELRFRGSQVIVPKALRSDFIKQIHSGHLGMEACVRRARDILYWPGMQSDVRQSVTQCSICNEHKPEQSGQPMISYPTPDRPWSIVSADLFSFGGRSYMIVVDHYSDFWELDLLDDTTWKAIVDKLIILFSRYGIPDTFIMDLSSQVSLWRHLLRSGHLDMSLSKVQW